MKNNNTSSKDSSGITAYVRGLIFPYIDERHFISVAILLLGLVITNQNAQKILDLIMQDFRLFFVLLAGFVVFCMIVFSKENLPVSFKVFACVLYYVLFAVIAKVALDKQNAQIHSDSLWSQINLLIVTTILMVSIIRGILALLTARTGSYDKISPSFKDTQYTFFGHFTTIIVSFSSGVLLGYFIKDTANSFLLGFLLASVIITVLESIVSKPMKYEDKKNIWIQ